MKKKFYLLLSACCFKLLPAMAAAFTPGNIVVLRVGTGTGALSSVGTAAFLDEYTTTGTLVQSIALSGGTGTGAFVLSGSATSEGLITRSANGQYIAIAGYNTAIGTTGVAGTASATVPRSVALVKYDGTETIPFEFTNFSTGNNPRSAYTVDGTSAYITGAATGIGYGIAGATTTTTISNTVTNMRGVNVAEYGGAPQLFVSTGSGTAVRIGAVGTGLPTSNGQTTTALPGVLIGTTPPTNAAGSSPYQFCFADLNTAVAGVDVMYVGSDDAGGITKYSLVGGTWTSNGVVGAAADAYRGLTCIANANGSVTIFAAGASKLVSITDNSGYNGTWSSSTVSTIATPATNTAFRSVAPAPFNSTAANTFVGSLSANFSLAQNYGSGTTPSATGDANIIAAGPANIAVLNNTAAVQNLTIGSGATFRMTGSSSLKVTGAITNSGTFTSVGLVELAGSGAQTISSGTFTGNIINSLTVSSNVTLTTSLTVSNLLTLNTGILTTGSNALILTNTYTGTIIGGSSGSYIAGTLTRTHSAIGGDAYFYPIGSSTHFRPVRLTNAAGVTAGNSFSATYFPAAYSNTTATNTAYTVSPVEYWDIARQSGTSAMNVSLITDNNSSSSVSSGSTVEVGHFNSSTSSWDNLGNNSGNTTYGASGSEIMTTGVSNFSPFTFITNTGSPLPVSLNAFSLKELSNTATQLLWSIPQAANVATVAIQRSEDGSTFQAIGSLSGSQVFNGTFTDGALPNAGKLYYRLKMLNPAGQATYSNTLVATHSTDGTLMVYPNPAISTVTLNWQDATQPVQITLTNTYGQQVAIVTPSTDASHTTLNVATLPAGQYIITWKQGSVTQHSKVTVMH